MEFVESMPQSLPILEAIYGKFFIGHEPWSGLKALGTGVNEKHSPENVVWQIVKFFAGQDQNGSSSNHADDIQGQVGDVWTVGFNLQEVAVSTHVGRATNQAADPGTLQEPGQGHREPWPAWIDWNQRWILVTSSWCPEGSIWNDLQGLLRSSFKTWTVDRNSGQSRDIRATRYTIQQPHQQFQW